MAGKAGEGLPPWWRWVVLAATFYMNAIVNGYAYNFGLIKIPMEEEYPDVSPVLLASIAGFISSLYMFLAPFAIAVEEYFGARQTTIVAACCAASCFVITWLNGVLFKGGFIVDFLALGVGEGTALAFLYGPSVAILPDYFPLDQLAFAAGVTNAGTSFGIIVYGFVSNPLFAAYGWRGTMLFYAAFALQGVLAGLAFRTVPKKLSKPSNVNNNQQSIEMAENGSKDNEVQQALLSDVKTVQPAVAEPEVEPKKEFLPVLRRFFDVKLFLQWPFVMTLLTAAFSIIGYFVPTLLAPGQAKNPKYGVHPTIAKNLTVMFGCLNLTGRVVIGKLGDMGYKYACFSSYWLLNASLVISAIAFIIFPQVMSLGSVAFVAFIGIYGFSAAPIITMRSVLTINLFGKSNASASYGWFLCAQGSLQMLGFIIPAWLNTFSPLYAYMFAASSFLVAAFSCLVTFKPFFAARSKQIAELEAAAAAPGK